MAIDYQDDVRPSRPIRTLAIVALLALFAGMALMAWAMKRWDPGTWLQSDGKPVIAQSGPTATGERPMLATGQTVAATPGQADAIDSRVAELESRMARIDLRAAAAAGNAARAEGLLVAFAARRAIDRGTSLGYIEGQLRDRFGTAQPLAIGAIITAAQNPVTIETLTQGLDQLAITDAAGGKDGWWQSTRTMIGDLFVVRRAGTPSPAPDQRIARARLMVEGGEVDRAMAEIARLPASADTSRWLTAARRWVEAHRALDLVEAAAITRPAEPGVAATN